jgi:hypothetical protein
MHVSLLMLPAAVLLGIPATILHGRLLRHQYTYHRDAWEEDGSIGGVFWHVELRLVRRPRGLAPDV